MASIREVQRLACQQQKERQLAAFFMLLAVSDAYVLKKEADISLIIEKAGYKKRFVASDEFELVQPLGNWLSSLPKSIWDKPIGKSSASADDTKNNKMHVSQLSIF